MRKIQRSEWFSQLKNDEMSIDNKPSCPSQTVDGGWLPNLGLALKEQLETGPGFLSLVVLSYCAIATA